MWLMEEGWVGWCVVEEERVVEEAADFYQKLFSVVALKFGNNRK